MAEINENRGAYGAAETLQKTQGKRRTPWFGEGHKWTTVADEQQLKSEPVY